MKLVISASSIEKVEKMLNDYHYSTTYKIVDNKVVFRDPPIENENFVFKTKGAKFQVYRK